ncbi:MAG: hypothetical protein JWM85_2929 [Acidimicrobiaceae bacterium]|nr:hypothetical protein [Acidimicrobiaceae bacterium]
MIYRLLTTATARRHLAAASATWLAYRRADCTSQADTYAGGSEALVAYVECLVQADGARTVNLRAFYKELSQGNATAPAFP